MSFRTCPLLGTAETEQVPFLIGKHATYHELPQPYVDALRNVWARPDLDLKRPARLEALKQLGKSG